MPGKAVKSKDVTAIRVSAVMDDKKHPGRKYAFFQVEGTDIELPAGAVDARYQNELSKESIQATLKVNPESPNGYSLELKPKTAKADIDAFMKS